MHSLTRLVDRTTRSLRVLIVDDHPIVREGLAELLNREKNIEVCAEAEKAETAMEALRSLDVDVAIVDLALPGLSGIELIRKIQAEFDDLPVIVLSMHDEQFYAERALRAGARGYVMKEESTDKLIEAIHQVHNGELFVSDEIAKKMLFRIVTGDGDELQPVHRLSDRELEVFQLIGQGYSTRKIAEMLHLSIKTIESYRANIKIKLDLKNAAELMQHAVKWVEVNRPD